MCVFCRLTRIVSSGDAFCHDEGPETCRIVTKVWLLAENKAGFLRGVGPKVTICFGPASAIIMPTASSVTQTSSEDKYEGKNEMRKQKGFSLIELLIVVAIILIIAAIAIPNLMRARMAANDSSAAASERSIVTAEVAYFSAFPTLGYPAAMTTLGGAVGAACVPSQLTAC